MYQLVKKAEEGLKSAGVSVKLFQVSLLLASIEPGHAWRPPADKYMLQVPETLPEEVLSKMYAPPKKDVPIISADQLPEADGFIFATPTVRMRAGRRLQPAAPELTSQGGCRGTAT